MAPAVFLFSFLSYIIYNILMIGECKFVNGDITEFYLTEWRDDYVPIYSSNNVISRIEWVQNDWYEIKINTASMSYSQEMSTINPNGIYYNDVVSISIPKVDNSKWRELVNILQQKYIIVIRDANNQYMIFGYRFGMDVRTYQISENQYIISFVGPRANNLPTFIDENYVLTNIIVSPTPSPTPSPTKTPTPSVTSTPSLSISATPSISILPSVSATPSVTSSVTPSITPSVSISSSVTPSISITPTITPTPSPAVYYLYSGITGTTFGTYLAACESLEPLDAILYLDTATPTVSHNIYTDDGLHNIFNLEGEKWFRIQTISSDYSVYLDASYVITTVVDCDNLPTPTPSRTPTPTPTPSTPSTPSPYLYSVVTGTTYSSSSAACSTLESLDGSIYFDQAIPLTGRYVYTDSGLTTEFIGEERYYYCDDTGSNQYAVEIDGTGLITNSVNCNA